MLRKTGANSAKRWLYFTGVKLVRHSTDEQGNHIYGAPKSYRCEAIELASQYSLGTHFILGEVGASQDASRGSWYYVRR